MFYTLKLILTYKKTGKAWRNNRLSPDGNLTLLHCSDDKRERLKGCIAFLDSLL